MWILQNLTPFPVERTFVRDRRGAEVFVVAIRATFSVRPDGRLQCAPEQVPVSRAAVFLGDPGRGSLKHDSDLVLSKSSVDVFLHGHAHVPRGGVAPFIDCSVRAPSWTKVIRVYGDRVFQRAAQSDAVIPGRVLKPFSKMPLVYERAWGGADPAPEPGQPTTFASDNPAGCGYARRPAALVGKPAPNLEDPRRLITGGTGPFPVVGFAPLASHWAPRARYAGTYDEKWKQSRAPLLPEDFDERFFQCAPADQQMAPFASDGQVFELTNLTPEGQMRVQLPKLRFWAETKFKDAETPHDARLHTIIFEPDERRVQMVWHTSLPCHGREHLIERSKIQCEGDPSVLVAPLPKA